ncbi:MAG TPA: DHA2 family efflux MFS transporter permease subunit [Bacteroidota bacterium]|nr:DHA2 family efflux MFS transporter permease subunit [Bacteroidota bacterium]
MVRNAHNIVRSHLINRYESLHHEHESYKWWVLANVMIGTFMAVLDATIVNVGLPKIMAAFGVSVDKVEWVLTAYLLVFAVMLPTSGWVADHFGYKRTYLFALLLFTLGSFLCGLSWDENALIVFRIVQGAGAGFLMPVGMAIVTREFPPEKRGVALGFWAIAAAASVSLGPLIGGYLIDNLDWQAIFDVNVPVGILGIFATLVIQREYKTEHVRSFDFIGFVSVATFLTFLLLALSDANAAWNIGGWTSDFTLGCFAIAAAGLTVFLITEFTVEHPLIELGLLKNYNFGLSNIVLFIFGIGMFGSTFLLPLYLQNSLGYTAFQAGSVFLPVGILQGMMSPVAGILSDRVNPKIPALAGIILLAVSLWLNSSLSLFSEHPQIMLSLYVRGLGMGLIFTPLSSVALSEIPRHKMAQASGLFNVIRQIGGSFGVALLGALLTQRTTYHIALYGQAANAQAPAFRTMAAHLQMFAQGTTGGTAGLAGMRAQALFAGHLASQAFVQAMNDDFLIASLVTLVGLVPTLFLRPPKHHTGGHTASLE